MKHLIKICGNQAIVYLTDKLYVRDVLLMRADLLEIIDQGVTEVTIDLSRLVYIHSSGLGTLVMINKQTKEKNGSLVLTSAQGRPYELIKRTRLDRVFIIE